MIAKIFDADGAYLRTTQGPLRTIELNTPAGGHYEQVEAFDVPPDPDIPSED